MDEISCQSFYATMKAAGWNVRPASENEDKFQHIDYHISRNGKNVKIELKSQKRGTESNLFLIELLGITGQLGWLFGKADLVCFDCGESGFLFVNRSKLYLKIREIFGFYVSKAGISFDKRTQVVDRPQDAIAPLIYRRSDRKLEAICYISKDILLSCHENII